MRAQAVVTVGHRPQPRTIGPVTQTDVVRFAGAGGDYNPLHHDAQFAATHGFDRPIAMGQMTAGILAAWLTDWSGVENLRDLEVRFTAPLTLGDTVELTGEVVSVDPIEDGLGLARVELAATRGDVTLLSGHATVVVAMA